MTYYDKVSALRNEIITATHALMIEHGVTSVDMPDYNEIGEGAWVICYDKNGEANECEVRSVSWSKDRGLVMRCYDRYTDHENTICTAWDYGARSIDLLATLHDLVGRTLRGEFNDIINKTNNK